VIGICFSGARSDRAFAGPGDPPSGFQGARLASFGLGWSIWRTGGRCQGIEKDAREQDRADSGAIGLRHLPPHLPYPPCPIPHLSSAKTPSAVHSVLRNSPVWR